MRCQNCGSEHWIEQTVIAISGPPLRDGMPFVGKTAGYRYVCERCGWQMQTDGSGKVATTDPRREYLARGNGKGL